VEGRLAKYLAVYLLATLLSDWLRSLRICTVSNEQKVQYSGNLRVATPCLPSLIATDWLAADKHCPRSPCAVMTTMITHSMTCSSLCCELVLHWCLEVSSVAWRMGWSPEFLLFLRRHMGPRVSQTYVSTYLSRIIPMLSIFVKLSSTPYYLDTDFRASTCSCWEAAWGALHILSSFALSVFF
jgi:hypothetical protein